MNSFESYMNKDYMIDGDTKTYRFVKLQYGEGQVMELVGELDEEGIMRRFCDPSHPMELIECGTMYAVSETVQAIH